MSKTRMLYPTFSRVDKMKGLVRVLTPLFDNVLGRFLVDDGSGNWIRLEDTPAIMLGYADIPSPDYPRIILNFMGVNDLNGAEVDSGVVELPNPTDPEADNVFVPYNTKYLRYLINVTVECGDINAVYRGERPASDEILTSLLTMILTDNVRESINTEMVSTIAMTNSIIPQTVSGSTNFQDTSSVLLMFHTATTHYNYDLGVFDTVVLNYELLRNNNVLPITGTITVTSDDVVVDSDVTNENNVSD